MTLEQFITQIIVMSLKKKFQKRDKEEKKRCDRKTRKDRQNSLYSHKENPE